MRTRPSKSIFILFLAIVSLVGLSSKSGARSLDVKTTIELAQKNNPLVGQAEQEIERLKGNVLQSRLFPNPEITVEVENFGGPGNLSVKTRIDSNTTLSGREMEMRP